MKASVLQTLVYIVAGLFALVMFFAALYTVPYVMVTFTVVLVSLMMLVSKLKRKEEKLKTEQDIARSFKAAHHRLVIEELKKLALTYAPSDRTEQQVIDAYTVAGQKVFDLNPSWRSQEYLKFLNRAQAMELRPHDDSEFMSLVFSYEDMEYKPPRSGGVKFSF